MKIPSFVWVILTLVIGGGVLLLLINNKNNKIYENVKLPVELEVYTDYNCPHCATFKPILKDIQATYGDKVQINSKHLPFLADTSTIYAQAAEAARKQDKFTEFDEALFKWITYQSNPNNTTYSYTDDEKLFFQNTVDVESLAVKLGLDLDKFNTDRTSQEISDLIKTQKQEAVKKIGQIATPVVFIYGQKFDLSGDLKSKVGELITLAEKKNQ